MKMIVFLANEHQAAQLREALQPAGFRMTQIASTGGFLRRGLDTIFVGVEDENVEQVIELARAALTTDGSALPYFILNVQRFERL